MTVRLEQIQSSLQRSISTVLQRDVSDPRIRGLVSVTKVQVSPDLSDAYVFVSVLPGEYGPLTVAGLNAAARHIRGRLSKTMRIRSMPRLDFRLDETLKKQAEIFSAINEGLPPDEDGASQPAEEPAK